jgi:cytochrome c oxidase cbb3-type subunit 2
MNNSFVFFIGLLGSIAISWGGLVLGPHKQLGGLTPFFDEGDSTSFPARPPGLATRGQLVYADLGCAACHTQQVRRPDVGSDQARGWGERQSVARDYIFQIRPQLGASRIGPDLTNLAGRKPSPPDSEDLMKLLYTGSALHPAYRFLFEHRAIAGERSVVALKLTGTLAPAPGQEVVPTERAQALVAYLLSLNNTYDYPESRPLPKAPGKKAAAHGAASAAPKEGAHK